MYTNFGRTLNSGGLHVPIGVSTFTPQEPLDPDLVRWWQFENNLTDTISGLSLTPSVGGTPLYEAAVYGNGARAKSTSRDWRLYSQTCVQRDGGADFTVSCWFKAYVANDYQVFYYPFGGGSESTILYNLKSQNKSEFAIRGSAGYIKADGPYLDMNNLWCFMAGTWDDTAEEAILYYSSNGAALGSVVGSEIGWSGPRAKLDGYERVGVYGTATGTLIDDMRVYKRKFSSGDVDALFQDGKSALGL